MAKRKGAPRTNTRGYRDLDGVFFASKAEWNRWMWLRDEATAGRIRELSRQVPFIIVINGITIGTYRADAVYETCVESRPHFAEWVRIIEDCKGWGAAYDWPFHKKVVQAACGITITEVSAGEWSDAACAKRRQATLQESMAL